MKREDSVRTAQPHALSIDELAGKEQHRADGQAQHEDEFDADQAHELRQRLAGEEDAVTLLRYTYWM